MSKQFLTAVIAILVAYAGFMTWLNAQNVRLNRQNVCATVPYPIGERPVCVLVVYKPKETEA